MRNGLPRKLKKKGWGFRFKDEQAKKALLFPGLKDEVIEAK